MKKILKILLNYVLFFAIGAGLVWWQISSMTEEEKQQFVHSVENAHYIYIVPVLILGLFSHYFRALRWKILIDPIKKVSAANTFYSVMIGYLGNTFIPRAGEILRCSMLTKYEKAPFSALLGTVLAERVFDMLSFILFTILTVVIQMSTVGNFVREKLGLIFQKGESTVPLWIKVAVPVVAILLLYFFTVWLFRRYSQKSWIIKIQKILSDLKMGLVTILYLRKKAWFLTFTFLIWACYLLQIYVGFKVIDVTSGLGLPAAMSVLTLSTIAYIVAPGGLGASPIAIQQVLLIYGIHNISFGWLVWGTNTVIIILAGLVCFGLIITQNRKNILSSPLQSPVKLERNSQIEPEEI